MSRLGDRRVRRDRFHQQAKRDGFRARAVYKLDELDRQFHVLGPGDRVLDLGCAPGSWLQHAAQKVGAPQTGALVGLDRTAIPPVGGARILTGDVMTITAAELLGPLPAFDVVLSDMAPDTSGIRNMDQARSEALFERAFELATLTLAGPGASAGGKPRRGGHFVGKLFQGPEFQAIIKRCRARFDEVRLCKPESSRQASIEQYVVCLGFKGREVASPGGGAVGGGATGVTAGGGATGVTAGGGATGGTGRGRGEP
jgi:23S rRNA (uridine2552-2'-O)-methyltransferase